MLSISSRLRLMLAAGLLAATMPAPSWAQTADIELPPVAAEPNGAKPEAVKWGRDKSKPLWELGVAGGGGGFPDYPGAAQNHMRAIALPFIRYRGETFRSDEKGLARGRIFRSDRVEFDFSATGSFAAKSGENKAREGMPDLDYMGEVGPRLQITLARAVRDVKIDLELPLRAVFSTDLSSIDYRGLVFAPEIAYQQENLFDTGVGLKLGIGPIFATEELMDYFYQVDHAYVRTDRPYYDAKAGYMEARLQLSLTRPIGQRVTAFGLARADFFNGSSNGDSPLLREDTNYSLGLGLTISLFQSERRVGE